MKTKSSVKKRSPDDKIVRRNGKVYIINKKILVINSDRDKIMLDGECLMLN